MSKVLTVMLIKNRALGDSIMGLSAVQYLKSLYPESNIVYAVPQWIAPLYSEVTTESAAIYPLKIKKIGDLFQLFKDIKKLKIDHIHEMHQTGTGAKVFKIISFLLGIRYTFHNHHIKVATGIIDQGKILPLIQRDLDGIFSFLGKGDRPSYLNFTPKMICKNSSIIDKNPARMIILGVVATRQTKMWPLENYAALAQLISKKYPYYRIVIPLSKNSEDQKIKASLQTHDLPENTTIVEWSLEHLPKQFRQASIYIGNDTGLKHLAVAIGLKTYTFFGPEPANEWHPYHTDRHPYFYLQDLACRTRTHHYCGLQICDLNEGRMNCLTCFSPATIFNEIEKELNVFLV